MSLEITREMQDANLPGTTATRPVELWEMQKERNLLPFPLIWLSFKLSTIITCKSICVW